MLQPVTETAFCPTCRLLQPITALRRNGILDGPNHPTLVRVWWSCGHSREIVMSAVRVDRWCRTRSESSV